MIQFVVNFFKTKIGHDLDQRNYIILLKMWEFEEKKIPEMFNFQRFTKLEVF